MRTDSDSPKPQPAGEPRTAVARPDNGRSFSPEKPRKTTMSPANPALTPATVAPEIDRNEPTFETSIVLSETEPKPRPFSRQFYQGALPAIQSNLSPKTVIPWLLLSSIVGVTIGTLMVLESDKIFELRVRYDHVNRYTYPRSEEERVWSATHGGRKYFAEDSDHVQGARAVVSFQVDRFVDPPIYLSYTIENMLQSHRQYASSISDLQLQGSDVPTSQLVVCQPLRAPGELGDANIGRASLSVGDASLLYGEMVYYPCGAVAWTMFNDSITIIQVTGPEMDNATAAEPAAGVSNETSGEAPLYRGTWRMVCNASDFDAFGERITLTSDENPCTKKDIAWGSDRNVRYKPTLYNRQHHWTGRGLPNGNTSDPYLKNGWYFREAGHRIPDVADEDLMVWNRIAPLPNFRKMHRIIHTPLFPGEYRVIVDEFFDVSSFKGKKGILLRSHSWLGARNYTLGIVFAVGGAVCFILAFAFFARDHIRRRHRRRDPNAYLASSDEELAQAA
jgi:hypothetical protein